LGGREEERRRDQKEGTVVVEEMRTFEGGQKRDRTKAEGLMGLGKMGKTQKHTS
jgi:hypothetical protein